MFKIIALVVIVAVTSFAGNYFSASLKNRLVSLKKINYLIDEIMILLRFRSATVYEISAHLAENERFSEFSFLSGIVPSEGVPFRKIWCDALEKNPPSGLKKSDTELLADIGRQLGTSDVDGQLSILKLQQNEAEMLISSAEKDCAQKAKLYRSLGVLAGAFISVMLI